MTAKLYLFKISRVQAMYRVQFKLHIPLAYIKLSLIGLAVIHNKEMEIK